MIREEKEMHAERGSMRRERRKSSERDLVANQGVREWKWEEKGEKWSRDRGGKMGRWGREFKRRIRGQPRRKGEPSKIARGAVWSTRKT